MVKPSRFRLFDHWRDVAIVAIDSWLETWSAGGGIEPRPKRRASERIAPVRLRKGLTGFGRNEGRTAAA